MKVMYGGRVVDGHLQSAVQEYRHPGGRSILLLGCVHTAEPDYYDQVFRIAKEAETSGATVFVEGIRRHKTYEGASEEEKTAIEVSSEALRVQYAELSKMLDLPWIHQEDSALYPYPSTWKPSDATALDLVRLVGPKSAVGFAPSSTKYEYFKRLKETKGKDSIAFAVARYKFAVGYMLPFKQWNKPARVYIRATGRVIRIVRGAVRLITRKPAPAGNRWMIPYMYTYRECIAALTALQATGNLVLIWHPGHMVNIGQILARNGFEPCEPQWLTACHSVTNKPSKNHDENEGEA